MVFGCCSVGGSKYPHTLAGLFWRGRGEGGREGREGRREGWGEGGRERRGGEREGGKVRDGEVGGKVGG